MSDFRAISQNKSLTLTLPSFLVPTPFTDGGRGEESFGSPCYLTNRYPHEHEILYGIKDTFERLRNVKVAYIVITWLP